VPVRRPQPFSKFHPSWAPHFLLYFVTVALGDRQRQSERRHECHTPPMPGKVSKCRACRECHESDVFTRLRGLQALELNTRDPQPRECDRLLPLRISYLRESVPRIYTWRRLRIHGDWEIQGPASSRWRNENSLSRLQVFLEMLRHAPLGVEQGFRVELAVLRLEHVTDLGIDHHLDWQLLGAL